MNAPRQAIDPEALRLHARHLEGVHDDNLTPAVRAARSTDVSAGAFGLLCSVLVPAQKHATTSCADAIEQLAELLTATSGGVRWWADNAEATEQAVVDTITAMNNEWEA